MEICLFQGRKEIILIYSDRRSLKYLKDKIETFSFAVKDYMTLKIINTKVYCSAKPKSISSHLIRRSKLKSAHVVRWF